MPPSMRSLACRRRPKTVNSFRGRLVSCTSSARRAAEPAVPLEREPGMVINAALNEDLPQVRRLLETQPLPLAGVNEHLDTVVVAENGREVFFCGGGGN